MSKKGGKVRSQFIAKLVTENRVPCAFCQHDVDDEVTFGKLYAIGDIQVHYFCVLLSCCLIQKGRDDHGLFGFLYPDIMAELERSKKHRCSYCSKGGATLGCAVGQCRKQFHLPCGRRRDAVSLFLGNYKSFCQIHAPKQSIPPVIMNKARVRMQEKKKMQKALKSGLVPVVEQTDDINESKVDVCVICYEEVDAFPTVNTFWPPCCARDAWFHRSCLQRMALSAGMHYLKCPLCNDKDNFYQAVVGQGYYVPDRDAAWELEQNAFAEIYERPLVCSMEECKCPLGRNHDAEIGIWDIKLCFLCGNVGAHENCLTPANYHGNRFVCPICRPAAPENLDTLAAAIETVIISEQARSSARRHGPVMPTRMSLRRTKQRMGSGAPCSSSQSNGNYIKTEPQEPSTNTITSRQELNIKAPRRQKDTKKSPIKENSITPLRNIDNQIFSPVKLLEQTLRERSKMFKLKGTENIVLDETVVERVRQITRKPKPLSEKKKIIDGLLEELLTTMSKDTGKTKSPIKEWNSPKKEASDIQDIQITTPKKTSEDPIVLSDDSSNSTFVLPSEFVAETYSDDSLPVFDTPKKLKTVEIQKDSSMEISENNDVINIDFVKIENDTVKIEDNEKVVPLKSSCLLKYKISPKDKGILKDSMDIDIDTFKSHYLNEVDRDFKSSSVNAVTKSKKGRKRKLKMKKQKSENLRAKRKRTSNSGVILQYQDKDLKKKKKKKAKKPETSLSITNDDMQVKISLKKKTFRLKIMQNKKPKLKQYVLKYSPQTSKVIEKPEVDVTPHRKKILKQMKSPDNLKQTSLHNFFKVNPKVENLE